jgi:hypothetical protein
LEARVVAGAAFVGVEEELVGADSESECGLAQRVEAGLGFAGFIAVQEGDVGCRPVRRGLVE